MTGDLLVIFCENFIVLKLNNLELSSPKTGNLSQMVKNHCLMKHRKTLPDIIYERRPVFQCFFLRHFSTHKCLVVIHKPRGQLLGYF